MSRFIALVGLTMIVVAGQRAHADFVLAGWTFETSVPTTAGPHAAEVGTGLASRFRPGGGASFANPVGNGSSESFASSHWSQNSYYQFLFSTAGLSDIKISFDQTHTQGASEFFHIQYSTDQVTYTTLSDYTVLLRTWNATTPVADSRFSFNFGALLDNSPTAGIRLTARHGGNSPDGRVSIDNVFITAVPEPSALLLLGVCAAPLTLSRRMRHTAT
jgi:hypothetical protein